MSNTIAVGVKLVNAKAKVSNPESRAGNLQDTRKNPHATDAGFGPGLPVSYWSITLMVISTMLL
jgi:hypothetical protein